MTTLALRRSALIISAAALLAGCGGSQPPISASSAVPQTATIAVHVERGKSWMLPAAKNGDLLYVGGGGLDHGYLHVYSYPQGKLVGKITGLVEPYGECVDSAGDLWVVTNEPPEAIEYAHGGTTPIATLNVPTNDYAYGCAVDPTTGNLAVTSGTGVFVYQNAQGTPTAYNDWDIPDYCSYDNKGNLFVVVGGGELTELLEGSSGFNIIQVDISGAYSTVQWDGHYLALGGVAHGGHKPVTVYKVAVSGTGGKVLKTTDLSTKYDHPNGAQFWVQGRTIVQPTNRGKQIGIWAYPAGGMPTTLITNFGPIKYDTLAVAVSPAQ
jgi:hypothetical protein